MICTKVGNANLYQWMFERLHVRDDFCVKPFVLLVVQLAHTIVIEMNTEIKDIN